MKLFTRVDSEIARKTTEIFIQQARNDIRSVRTFAFLIPFAQAIESVAIPLLISFIIQILIQGGEVQSALWLIGFIAVGVGISATFEHIGFKILFRHEENVTTRLLKQSLDKLLGHSFGFFANQKVGSLAGDIHNFSRAYMSILDTIFLQLSSLLVSFAISLIVIGIIAPALLLPLLLLTVFVVWHNIYSVSIRAPYRNARKELQSKLFGSVADIIGNHALVRLFSKKDVEVGRIVRERGKIIEVFEQEVVVLQHNATVRRIVIYAFQIVTLLLCIYLYSNAMIQVGALVFAITYSVRVAGAMFGMSSAVRGIEQAYLDSSKAVEILAATPDITDHSTSETLSIKNATIDFRDMSFSYADAPDEPVFSQLNLSIPAGQHVGLVGKSGGGKTTLTSLLLRFADVTSGAIIVNEHDISRVTQSSLRDTIAYVPQDPYLFHRTLRENIAYGADSASDEDVVDATKKANAWEFIKELPKGLDTVVGERGVKLSGGQRQRVAIARAILKDAPILVLDEATSALDSESEKLIQASLDELMKGRTSIVIAHRLSTIAKLDRIVVLDHGKIVEDGSHTELLAQKGTYAKLWAHQSGGFIEE